MSYTPKHDTVNATITGDAVVNANEILTLASVNSNVGTFGNSTTVPVITVNAKGLITSVSSATISGSGIYVAKSGDSMTGDLNFDSTEGRAIKIANSYGWRDLIGDIVPKSNGVDAPTLSTFRGNIRAFSYSVNDAADMIYHLPHDYAPGTDLFLHLHWAHNGTNISGTFQVSFYTTYAKGHQQQTFPAEKTVTLTVGSLNITNTPQYLHRVDEVQLSTTGGGTNLLNTNDIEVDGLILMQLKVTGIPTITGGTTEPLLFTADLHYQSTGINTKNKSPNFYT